MEAADSKVIPYDRIIMAGQPTSPGPRTLLRNKGLIVGLIKGKQWVLISPDHKAGYFGGGVR